MLNLAVELMTILKSIRAKPFKTVNHELKHAERHLLLLLCNNYRETPIKPSELAKKTGVTLPAISHQINNLEKLGYIERLSNPKDKRVSLISLSEKGKKVDEEFKKTSLANIVDIFEYLGEKDSKELIRIISLISEYVNKKNME